MTQSVIKENDLFISKNTNEKISYDYSKLVGKIVEKYGTRESFAKAYGCTIEHLSKFLNNKWFLKQPGIDKMCVLLDIPDDEIYSYFFTKVDQYN